MKAESVVQSHHDYFLRMYQFGDTSVARTLDAMCFVLDHPYCVAIR